MSRETWALIKNHKNFNVHVYRRAIKYLIISLILSNLVGLYLFYLYITQPERDYYASSGVVPPIQLNAMLSANYSSKPLLEPDPPIELEQKLIPQ